ncbi:MAG TPA: hypothetical protein VHZ99_14035 [Steroidobacteraceae bacterium]|jgi:hypothetical protein|nr:hypothetical protein [Steroidobacteraceae bacterium]
MTDLERFARGEWNPATFKHRDHVRMGFEMLRRYTFDEAVFRFSTALRTMTAAAGKPQAFNQTVTIAFLSLIGERIEADSYVDFDSFAALNPELLEKSALSQRYRPERLATDLARRTFLLP